MALIEVCDRCRGPKPVVGYTITRDGGSKVRVVLCEEHEGAVVEVMGLVKEQPAKAPAKRAARKPRTPRVTSMEEIEALKG